MLYKGIKVSLMQNLVQKICLLAHHMREQKMLRYVAQVNNNDLSQKSFFKPTLVLSYSFLSTLSIF